MRTKRRKGSNKGQKTVVQAFGTKAIDSPKGNNMICYGCGKSGHCQKQCPKKRKSALMQACEVLPTTVTTNLEGGSMPKHGALAILLASPTTSSNHNLDNLKCFECGKNGHFRSQCPNNKLSAPTQADVVLSTGATIDLEGGNTPKFEASMALHMPLSNRNHEYVKCFECGKSGHYQSQCSERKSGNMKCFERGKSGHYQNRCSERKIDNGKCFECGKSGHYRNQCPERKISSPVQAYEPLLTITTTNLEGGNMSKHGAPATSAALPMTPDNHNLDNLKYCECGKNEHFQNQCWDNKVSAPTQVDAVLPTIITTNLEAIKRRIRWKNRECTNQVGTTTVSSEFETSTCSLTATCSTYGTSTSVSGQSFSTAAFDNTTSSFGSFESMQLLSAGAFGSPSNHSTPFGSSKVVGSSSTFGAPNNSPFDAGAASSPVFGQSSTPAFDADAASSPVFGQTSTPAFGTSVNKPTLFGSTSTSACDFQNTSSLCGSSSIPALATGTSASAQQSTTTSVGLHSNQSSPPVSHHAISSSTLFGVPGQYAFGAPSTPVFGQSSTTVMGKAGSQMKTPGNQMRTPENQTTTPENQTTTPESQTTAPECLTTPPGSQTGISDQQKNIETPYCSTQDTCGKSVSILDKSTFKDKHYEELRREDYHCNKGCDREQVQAWGQTQSSPFGLTNIASSFDQSPKTDTPQLPVVVTSENNKGSGDTPYMATKTSVWWDIENCPVPRGNSDTYYIAQNISSALADAGYKGAVTISAYGDTHKIPKAVQQALSSTGIALNHVPAGVKDASDKKILVDMLFWAVDNPPPANYLLISGDRDFSNALHQLRLRRYNILLAHAPSVSQALVAAAKKVWQWASLLSGGRPLQDLESGTNKSNFDVIKEPIPKRLRWKDQNARETQKTFSVSQSKEGCDIQSENQVSFSKVSKPETSEITRPNCAPISSPSHEIVCGKRPRDLVDSSEQMPFKSIFNLDNEKNPFNSQPFKLCRVFAPSNSSPSQNNNNYSFTTQPTNQPIMFGLPHLQSMQNKSEVIQHPANHHQNIKPSQIYNDNQNNGYQVHSSEAHRHVGYIVSALTELKANKIAPTEENISNCIHYGMGKRSFNVKIALDYACENNILTRYNLDNGTLFYLGKNEQFWECANVLDITDKHSEETWNAIRNFLSSASGRSAISSTECRYHAATLLKKTCLQHLVLGEVLQLLNTVIKFRKWIVPNTSGWQPLWFTLKVVP